MHRLAQNPPLVPLDLMRLADRAVMEFIDEGSKVLDLGCGDGTLLAILRDYKKCRGTGIEIDESAIYKCLEKGLSVSHGDIDTILNDYSNKRFDYVILSESLQQCYDPEHVILESFRIGKKVIVVVPNFCHLSARLQIFFRGRVPVTKELPFEWYDTPNLRFLSIKDFADFCRDNRIRILKAQGITDKKKIYFKANLFAKIGCFLLEKK
jgi:methionine biosynthesis protein MetW